MTKPGIRRPVVIKAVAAIPVTHILTNLLTAGMAREEYLRLWDQVR